MGTPEESALEFLRRNLKRLDGANVLTRSWVLGNAEAAGEVLAARTIVARGGNPNLASIGDPALVELVHEFVTQLNRPKMNKPLLVELEKSIRAHLAKCGRTVEPLELRAPKAGGA